MLTGHCVVLRLHAFSRSRDRSLKPRSQTTMLVSTRVLIQNGRRTHVVRGWRVVSIPKEDARRTDIAACIIISICEHDYDAFEPFSPPSGSRDAPVRALIGRAQSAMGFQDVSLNVCYSQLALCFCISFIIINITK